MNQAKIYSKAAGRATELTTEEAEILRERKTLILEGRDTWLNIPQTIIFLKQLEEDFQLYIECAMKLALTGKHESASRMLVRAKTIIDIYNYAKGQ
jgi:hypothetical protein